MTTSKSGGYISYSNPHRGCTMEYAYIYTFSQKGEITPEHN